MAIDQETEMTDAEIDDFLGQHETGVLSLARTDDPYAIPISYGYDGDIAIEMTKPEVDTDASAPYAVADD